MTGTGLAGGTDRRATMPPDPDDLPAALASMRRILRLGYDNEPGLLIASFALTLLAAVPDALLALWLKLLGNGVQSHDATEVLLAGIGLGVSTTATWLLRVLSVRVQRRFRDRVSIALESHVARLQATISTIGHQERPELLDRISVLRNQVFVLDHMYMSLLTTASWLVRLGITVVLLMSVHPALVLIALFAIPTVVTSGWRPAVERAAEEAAAPDQRLAKHLYATLTTASSGKEVRVTGTGAALAAMRHDAAERYYRPIAAARWRSAWWYAAGWAIFGLAYVAGIVFVAQGLHRSAGDVLLVLAAGSRLSSYIAQTVTEIGFLRGVWLDGSRRLVWLERYAAAVRSGADRPAPGGLGAGITVEHLSFAYPGTDRLVLSDVSVHLPAGTVVAIVGENGAGKSTLVKLLCKLYEPSAGSITVDGVPLAEIDADQWRSRTAGAFQDFARFEFRAGQSIGLGDLPRIDDDVVVRDAVARAGADDVIARLPLGLRAQLGANWPDGVDLSAGQWQKVALARGFARTAPLLMVLDEPTSALDAETEHALFERYAAARSAGGITLLVSHRFSTVRMADLIVVLDGARVAEVGSHEQLMSRDGQYAQLYTIQATSYR